MQKKILFNIYKEWREEAGNDFGAVVFFNKGAVEDFADYASIDDVIEVDGMDLKLSALMNEFEDLL